MGRAKKLEICAYAAGVWSIAQAVIELSLMGWQTAVVLKKRKEIRDRRVPNFGYAVERLRWPGDYPAHYTSPEEGFYNALFAMQVINLAAHGILLVTIIGLFIGIKKKSRLPIWPWFLAMGFCIAALFAHSITWWTRDTYRFTTVFTAMNFAIASLLSTPCLCLVIAFHRTLPKLVPRHRLERQRAAAYAKNQERVYQGDFSNPSAITITSSTTVL